MPKKLRKQQQRSPLSRMMWFHVGPYCYRLIISNRRIYDAQGDELEGCAIESRRLMIVSRIVEPDRREEIAVHEYFHCWQFHVPASRDEEESARLLAMVNQAFRRDLDAQGGPPALAMLTPQRVPKLGVLKTREAKMRALVGEIIETSFRALSENRKAVKRAK